MIRWPLLVIGIIMIILSMIMRSENKPLSENAEKITLDQALAYLNRDEKKYVEIDASVDTSKVVYGTVVKKPYYTTKPTDRTYRMEDIKARNEFIGGYVGTVISAGRVLSGNSILLQTVSENDEKEKQVLRERVLAHVTDRIWVLSPLFKKSDIYGRETWLSKNEYEGGLIYFKDLLSTVRNPEIENKLSDIINFAQTEFGINIPEDAFVLIDGYGTGFTPKAYYPVQGSNYSLFLVADPNSGPGKLKSITGILQPSLASHYEDLPKLLKTAIGNRIGTIVQETAASYNTHKENDAKETSTIGGILLIFALIGFLRKRMKKAKQIIQKDKNSMRGQL